MRYTRISADCHIDMPWLPPDLFTTNASALMKDIQEQFGHLPPHVIHQITCENAGKFYGLMS
jgi:hypothetical protein